MWDKFSTETVQDYRDRIGRQYDSDTSNYWAIKAIRLALMRRDGDGCCWCGVSTSNRGLRDHKPLATIEHMTPQWMGGKSGLSLENLSIACKRCNHTRGDDIGPPQLTPSAA